MPLLARRTDELTLQVLDVGKPLLVEVLKLLLLKAAAVATPVAAHI